MTMTSGSFFKRIFDYLLRNVFVSLCLSVSPSRSLSCSTFMDRCKYASFCHNYYCTVLFSASNVDVRRRQGREEGERVEDGPRLPRRFLGQGQLHRRILPHHRRPLHPRLHHSAGGHGLQTDGIQVRFYLHLILL
jgi:hypothetical protein